MSVYVKYVFVCQGRVNAHLARLVKGNDGREVNNLFKAKRLKAPLLERGWGCVCTF